MNWREALAQVLHSTPDICAMDAGAQGIAAELSSTQVPPCGNNGTLRASLALVQDALHGLDATQAGALLAHIRDFVAPRILVIADANCPLNRLDFIAFGYETLTVGEGAQPALYQFDIATYKQVPDWLNARYWAHPERWKP